MSVCKVSKRDLYYMDINLSHRRLFISDKCRLIHPLPLKRLYPSCGCFLEHCVFAGTCNECFYSYDILDL